MNDLVPRTNPHLVGHERAEQTVLDAWRSGRMAHGWLIAGPRGVGKATLAYRIARFALSQPAAGAAPPGLFADAPAFADSLHLPADAPVFRRVAAGGHADLAVVERTVGSSGKLRGEIVVDDVRAVSRFLRLTAGEGGWRIVIVDAADEMNRNAANALLKLLEEPPPASLFLLVAHGLGRVPPTIRSRCRTLRLESLPDDAVVRLLATLRPELDEASRRHLARLSDGSIGDALSLADCCGLDLYRDMVGLIGGLPNLDIAALHSFADRAAAGDGGAAFLTLARLIDGWLVRLVLQHARGVRADDLVVGEGQVAARLAAARSLAEWVSVWEKVRRLFRDADTANLDRKHVVVSAFEALAGELRP